MKFSNAEIDNLAKVMNSNGLNSVSYEQEGCKIMLSRGNVETTSSPHAVERAQIVEDSFKTEIIKCPLIGHFYLTPTPDSDPYVRVGTKINKEDVVGILQAMKVSNEIKSEIAGEIVEVFIENGQFVDFDAPLFKVRV